MTGAMLAACLLAVILALAGGASRADAASQIVVRSAAVLAIACALGMRGSLFTARQLRPAFWMMMALAALIAAQLTPLPPDLWLSLPGRAHYAEAATMLGQPQPWRPLNLTPDLGWNALLALLPCAAVLAFVAVARGKEARIGPTLVMVVAVSSALLGIAQLAGGPESVLRYYSDTSIGSPTGFFTNRNHQAMMLACALPIIAYWATDREIALDRVKARRLTAFLSGLVLMLVIAASGSRAGLVLGVIGALIAGTIIWPTFRYRQSYMRIAVVAGTMLLIIGVALALYHFDRLPSVNRLLAVDDDQDMRLKWLGPAMHIIRDFFPWGTGFGSFDSIFRQYEPLELLRFTYANQLHNEFVQLVLEAGLPGLVLEAAFAAGYAVQCTRIVRAPASRDRVLALVGIAVTAMLVAGSIFDYPLRTPLLSGVFVLAVSWMLAIGTGPQRIEQG
ncbi:O-antigen ligase [uncultured Sphingomonas sp.]|uniref:O-antigen ligase family protein n=1 Tax=uncultured Sphingomonas sp. TaxID=158754 RepID=UPI002637ED50|nr:O-antigen ligase family protein [uncultured Sphingomonas sp.]